MTQKSNSLFSKADAGSAVVQVLNGVYFKPLPDGDYLFRAKLSLLSRSKHFRVSAVQHDQILAILVPKPPPVIVWREMIATILPRLAGLVLVVVAAIFSLAMLYGGGTGASVIAAGLLTVPVLLTIFITIGSRQQRRRLLSLQPVLAGLHRADQTITDAEITACMRAHARTPCSPATIAAPQAGR